MSNLTTIGFNQIEFEAMNKLSEHLKFYVSAKNEQKNSKSERKSEQFPQALQRNGLVTR